MASHVPRGNTWSIRTTTSAGLRVVRAVVLVTLFVAVSMLAPRWAMGTAPVKKTLNGCVAGLLQHLARCPDRKAGQGASNAA